jgi:hypothetical protein
VFGLAFMGISSKRLETIARNNVLLSKAMIFAVFSGMGIIMHIAG